VQEIIASCHAFGVPVLVDASQSIAHEPHDVRELQCDYLAFSGHKIYGPGGTGVLYVRNEVIETMEPVFVGGGMVKEVHVPAFQANDIPYRFEVGTPNIDGVIGLAEALEYVSTLGYTAVTAHENALVQYAKHRLTSVPGLSMYGPSPGEPCAPLVSFQLKGLESTAVAKILANRENVIVRSGFHCAQPAHDGLGIGPTVRASFGIYNTKSEIDAMVDVLHALSSFLD
jgi:cysteine desulfurase/selenocysteine lyase